MSLCIGLKTDKGHIVAVDGRVSTRRHGVCYCASNTAVKYIIHKGKLVVTFGVMDIVHQFQKHCQRNPQEDNLEILFDFVIDNLSHEDIRAISENNCLPLAIYSFDLSDNNGMTVYGFYYDKTGKHEVRDEFDNYFTFGEDHEKAGAFIADNIFYKKINAVNLLFKVFEFINSERVGGQWKIFLINDKTTQSIGTYNSTDEGLNILPSSINTHATISAGGITGDRVTIQANNHRMIEMFCGGLEVNGDRVVTRQQIEELEKRINLLETGLQNSEASEVE